ncbi:hypothetical protein DFH09DRAFT_1302959 [Mycena vulgaris]|nr:hypothetical protein DFH09DRAFT_1302959 [Mycena vulgaris]
MDLGRDTAACEFELGLKERAVILYERWMVVSIFTLDFPSVTIISSPFLTPIHSRTLPPPLSSIAHISISLTVFSSAPFSRPPAGHHLSPLPTFALPLLPVLLLARRVPPAASLPARSCHLPFTLLGGSGTDGTDGTSYGQRCLWSGLGASMALTPASCPAIPFPGMPPHSRRRVFPRSTLRELTVPLITGLRPSRPTAGRESGRGIPGAG